MDMDNAAHFFKVGDAVHVQIGTDFHAATITHVYGSKRRVVATDVHGGVSRWFSLRKDNVWRFQGPERYRLRPGHRHQMDTTR
jgi:hypothetical protein